METRQDATGISRNKPASSDAPLKPDADLCECCGRRPKAVIQVDTWNHTWQKQPYCGVCIAGQERRGRSVPTGIVPERYAASQLADLPSALVEKYRSLPDETGLLLWGLPGTGKSHAMCAFASDLWVIGWDVIRISYEMLQVQIRDTFKAGAEETELDVVEPLIDVGKLIIEDVGTTVSVGAQESDFSLRTFLVLLDHRLEHCRATFVTSNKGFEELGSSFDQRVASRLMQACEVVQLKGQDRRKATP